jgi:hypothetical protein
VRSWLTPERGEPEVFAAEVKAVCDLYAAAPALHARGVRLVGTDEKTGIQALEPRHPTLPTRPGLIERREAEYVRHGTQCLIANFEVATGHIVAPTVGPTRTAADFAAHIARTVATAPQAEWVFVVDQLNTHQSEALVEVVADLCAIALERDARGCPVGLRAMAARRTFLADPRHRVRFVYTPVHTSWLNQVELWFSILSRRLLKRGRFTSTDDLRQQLLAFVAYFNRTLARPFRWTYTGRPLTT